MSLARHCVHWGLHTRNWLLVNCDRQCIDHVSALSAAALQGGFEIGKCRRKITTHHWSVSFTRILRPRIFLWADDVGKIFRIFYIVTPLVKLLLYRSRIELGWFFTNLASISLQSFLFSTVPKYQLIWFQCLHSFSLRRGNVNLFELQFFTFYQEVVGH